MPYEIRTSILQNYTYHFFEKNIHKNLTYTNNRVNRQIKLLTLNLVTCYNDKFYLTFVQVYGTLFAVRWSIVAKTLIEIKQGLEGHVGERLKLKANGGRRKTIERSGVLAETYPSVFIVELDQEENAFERVSYSYADVLTETVELSFSDEHTIASVIEQ
ncbi:hypothetical protein GCM10007111_19040 [Virgibacillus kapii]|uniref:Veg protein n=2 Tax=Virgibacillus TaxID=84406 RepID=A0A024Q5L1_9BACI|nr:hypothetical protein GCM10007111_19040 [Virgibacillus kapii]CDQ37779.1 hypothetical protein BN990_00035 [Virgibacillus massiliensis]